METLTKKQKRVFDFVNDYILTHDISPTIEEVRKGLKLKAVSTIHEHLVSLKKKGYLSKSNNPVKGLSIEEMGKQKFIKVPIIGTLIARQLTEADKKDPRAYFALKVQGNNLAKVGIPDGLIVIFKFTK
ncbi:hypothetical protein A3I46_03530 [Candidatus Kaiserbacteria bacterium RIFCSPLOWO2_02_FULL_54_13]|uniref:LexA repressor DNA-binding domain-containing protein n=1 Tax=Candidatus Kaiserbacteria bacterium RIFCSPHIGHO2_02_FULL_54_22 TaxID=1798495 RepID=A0A1F6DKP2_9BACT|nr:MAG: hypothetical protein A3C19_00910 [Candidatus Kaiserbacteria bacterium RIFCSPHIGHO2_02_FULL_54_22]OGG69013.1 MAG: hypothetical protein A3E99_01575 [Candidatus Kaiserbacteria bacterium RIFCSPHIGHO2_12_FULL_54_16]OGG83153.1 MAG: hypothetical protein A3I46_03530 [Candidatus Kaiserbacteria bacterium RIFCSPLOWO2_02_FULL_54_13]